MIFSGERCITQCNAVPKQIHKQDAFRHLFEENYGALCNYAMRIVVDRGIAEDTVQSVFIRLWENREDLEITGSVKSYLFNAVRNAALDHLRSVKRQDKYLEQVTDFDLEFPREDDSDMQIFRYKLFEAIKKLKPKTQEIFVLHKIEGLTYNEIAEHLNLPRRTVEYNIYAALTQLRDQLKADYEKYVAA